MFMIPSKIAMNFITNNKNIIFFDEEENKGVVYARNMAIDAASGDYILPLDADDKIEPSYVEKAAKILDNNSDIGIVYCNAEFFGAKTGKCKLPEFNEELFLTTNCIFATAMFRKKDFLNMD